MHRQRVRRRRRDARYKRFDRIQHAVHQLGVLGVRVFFAWRERASETSAAATATHPVAGRVVLRQPPPLVEVEARPLAVEQVKVENHAEERARLFALPNSAARVFCAGGSAGPIDQGDGKYHRQSTMRR